MLTAYFYLFLTHKKILNKHKTWLFFQCSLSEKRVNKYKRLYI